MSRGSAMAFDAVTPRRTRSPVDWQVDQLSLADDLERARRDAEIDNEIDNQIDNQTERSTMYPDLVAALGELGDVPKSRTADTGSYRYSYADLADILAEVRPVLARHHLAVSQYAVTNPDDKTLTIATRLIHVSGDHYAAGRLTYPLPPNIQSFGSLMTYLRRYSLVAALGIASTDEDDDGQTATQAPVKPPRTERTRGVSQSQTKKLGALMDEAGVNKDAAARRQLVSDLIGREIQTRNDLTGPEATVVIDAMQAIVDGRAGLEVTDDGAWRLTEAVE